MELAEQWNEYFKHLHTSYFIAPSIQIEDSVPYHFDEYKDKYCKTCIFNECSWFIIAHEEEIWDPTPNKIFRRINSFANQSIIDIMILSRGLKTCWPGGFWIQSQAFILALEYYSTAINDISKLISFSPRTCPLWAWCVFKPFK